MNRKILAVAASAVAVCALAASASAQTSKPVGLSIRAGVGWPTSGNNGHDTLFCAGAEFKISDANWNNMGGPGTGGHISLSADYLGRNSAYAFPVLINYVGQANEFFYSVGAGASFDHGGSGTSNKTNFGYQFGLGYNFQQAQTPLFLEAKFFGSSKSDFNAIGVYLGIRL